MTVATTTSTVNYLGNGVTTVFTFPFIGVAAADIVVTVTDSSGVSLVLNPTQYTLVINPVPVGGLWGIGGSVTYPIGSSPVSIPVGYSISITRALPYTQTVSISNQGAFYPQAVEQALDKLELQIQQIENNSGLAIQVPVNDPAPSTILPMPVLRKSKLIGFDGTGENLQMYPTSAVLGPIAFLSQTVTHAMSPYTASTANVLFVNASAGNVVITLPSASTVNEYFISRVDNSYVNSVTINAQSGQTILGASSFPLLWQYQSNVFLSNGSTSWSVTSQFRKQSSTVTTGSYVSNINILDVINDSYIINSVLTRTFVGYLDSYINAAIALGGTIFFPSGEYRFANPVTMAAGVVFQGAGIGNTVFVTGGSSFTDWGFELLLPNGVQRIEAPKFKDMTLEIPFNGIRWNSITGGFTDDSSSQQYMMRPVVERCYFDQDNASRLGIAIQMNKCFDHYVANCEFSGFAYPINYEGTDSGVLFNNRTDQTQVYEVLANSHSTFGNNLLIDNNDFNDPGATNVNGGFVNSSYRQLTVTNNHMELDSGVVRTNLIKIDGPSTFSNIIHNNRIEANSLCTNWLSVAPTTNNYLVSVFNNITASSPATMGTISYASQSYFNNAGGRCLVRHGGNGSGDNIFPMNVDQEVSKLASNVAANVTAGGPGVSFANSTINPSCNDGAFLLPADANVGHFMEISDWNAIGLPANQLIGTLTIDVLSFSNIAGQVGSWEILDGGVSVSSGTITHTTANKYYVTNIITSHAFTTKAQVRLWNADTVRNGNFYIRSAVFTIG